MKLATLLPNFEMDPSLALDAAAAAASAGLDGVFCYDHLWPMGEPSRPALAPFPLLAAVATRLESLALGTLVARVGLVAEEQLLAQFAALDALAPGRVVAALGTGDSMSARENLAYGLDFAPASERRASLRRLVAQLLERGFETWIGGGAEATLAIADELGCAVNLWGASPTEVAEQARSSAVTWAGLAPEDDGELRELLGDLEGAGASWAVFAKLGDPERLRSASRG